MNSTYAAPLGGPLEACLQIIMTRKQSKVDLGVLTCSRVQPFHHCNNNKGIFHGSSFGSEDENGEGNSRLL
jgi:hypothetical protein